MLCTVNVISLYLQGLHFHSPTYRYVLMDVKRYNNHVCLLPAVPIRYTDTAGGRAKRAHLLVLVHVYNVTVRMSRYAWYSLSRGSGGLSLIVFVEGAS